MKSYLLKSGLGLIDLPDHDAMVSVVTRYRWAAVFLRAALGTLALVMALLALATYLFDAPGITVPAFLYFAQTFAPYIFPPLLGLYWLESNNKLNNTGACRMAFCAASGGLAYAVCWWLEADTGSTIAITAFATLFGGLLLAPLAVMLVLLPGRLLAKPITSALASRATKTIQRFGPEWSNFDDSPIVVVSDGNVNWKCDGKRIFVEKAQYRRDGQAHEHGYPRFTWQELCTPGFVREVNKGIDYAKRTGHEPSSEAFRVGAHELFSLGKHAATTTTGSASAVAGVALGAAGLVAGAGIIDMSDAGEVSREPLAATSPEINPTTGLPMVGGIGGVDVAGNAFGTDSAQTFDQSPTGSGHDFGSSSGFDHNQFS